jgi:hypothetical protein
MVIKHQGHSLQYQVSLCSISDSNKAMLYYYHWLKINLLYAVQNDLNVNLLDTVQNDLDALLPSLIEYKLTW